MLTAEAADEPDAEPTLAAATEVQRLDVAAMHEKALGILATLKASGVAYCCIILLLGWPAWRIVVLYVLYCIVVLNTYYVLSYPVLPPHRYPVEGPRLWLVEGAVQSEGVPMASRARARIVARKIKKYHPWGRDF